MAGVQAPGLEEEVLKYFVVWVLAPQVRNVVPAESPCFAVARRQGVDQVFPSEGKCGRVTLKPEMESHLETEPWVRAVTAIIFS